MSGMRVHRVMPGETLSSIAQDYYGHGCSKTYAMVIFQHNRDLLLTPTQVTTGMELVIPHVHSGMLP